MTFLSRNFDNGWQFKASVYPLNHKVKKKENAAVKLVIQHVHWNFLIAQSTKFFSMFLNTCSLCINVEITVAHWSNIWCTSVTVHWYLKAKALAWGQCPVLHFCLLDSHLQISQLRLFKEGEPWKVSSLLTCSTIEFFWWSNVQINLTLTTPVVTTSQVNFTSKVDD